MSIDPSNNGSVAASGQVNMEVVARPDRRRFTAEYKVRILREADQCGSGEVGALLRREGLYSSHLTTWRRQRNVGQLAGLTAKNRERRGQPRFVAGDGFEKAIGIPGVVGGLRSEVGKSGLRQIGRQG